jgi:hypothetical protein
MVAQQGSNDRFERIAPRSAMRWGGLIGLSLLLTGVIVFALRSTLYLGLCTGCMRLSGEGTPSALYTALEGGGLGLMVAGLLLIVVIYKAPILYGRLLTVIGRTLRSTITVESEDQAHHLSWVVFGMFGASLFILFALFRWRNFFFGRVEGPGEIIQESGYFLAAGAMMVAAYLLRGTQTRFARIVYALIGLVVLLIFLEEISWGQWLFGFETPAAISSRNQQQEFNFHNFYIVDQVDEVFAPLILVVIGMTLVRIYLEASGELTAFADLVLPDIYMLVPLIFSFVLSAFLASSALRAAIEARGILDLHYPLEQEVQEVFISLSALAYGVGRLRLVSLFNQGNRAAPPPLRNRRFGSSGGSRWGS